jgi:hypothetical protein
VANGLRNAPGAYRVATRGPRKSTVLSNGQVTRCGVGNEATPERRHSQTVDRQPCGRMLCEPRRAKVLRCSESDLRRWPLQTLLNGRLRVGRNFIAMTDNVALVDLDAVSTGPAAADLGCVLSDLVLRRYIGKFSPATTADVGLQRALLEIGPHSRVIKIRPLRSRCNRRSTSWEGFWYY